MSMEPIVLFGGKFPLSGSVPAIYSAAEIEECCCPAPSICPPDLLEAYNVVWNSICTSGSVVENRFVAPVTVTGSGCYWDLTGVSVETRTDGGAWSLLTDNASVILRLVTSLTPTFWALSVIAFGSNVGFPPVKTTGASPAGSYYKNEPSFGCESWAAVS